MSEIGATDEERKAIAALKRLASKWPSSLWLFTASGTITVMRMGEDGAPVYAEDGGVDQRYILDRIDPLLIRADGGDW